MKMKTMTLIREGLAPYQFEGRDGAIASFRLDVADDEISDVRMQMWVEDPDLLRRLEGAATAEVAFVVLPQTPPESA